MIWINRVIVSHTDCLKILAENLSSLLSHCAFLIEEGLVIKSLLALIGFIKKLEFNCVYSVCTAILALTISYLPRKGLGEIGSGLDVVRLGCHFLFFLWSFSWTCFREASRCFIPIRAHLRASSRDKKLRSFLYASVYLSKHLIEVRNE
jgi:hypothetical protein